MELITKILYWISTGLMIPVIVLLLIFFIRALLLVGTFYSMYVNKIKFNKTFKSTLKQLDVDNVREELTDDLLTSKLLLNVYLKNIKEERHSELYYEKLLTDFEIDCQKDLSGSQVLAKLGPTLGLMGTLIPMGPALVGLASGDIASMASNMQVAFATTVIGLVIGAIGFVVVQIKKRWYAADLNNLEYIVALIQKNNTDEKK